MTLHYKTIPVLFVVSCVLSRLKGLLLSRKPHAFIAIFRMVDKDTHFQCAMGRIAEYEITFSRLLHLLPRFLGNNEDL